MPRFIDRDEVQRLVDERHATVAEVLPRAEYEWAHLPDAVHLPLKGWDPQAVRDRVDADRPIIVYCNDFQ